MEKKHTLDAYDNYFILGDGGKRVIKIDAYKSFILGNGERNDILKDMHCVSLYFVEGKNQMMMILLDVCFPYFFPMAWLFLLASLIIT